MTENRSPAFQFYPMDYLSDINTMSMTAEQEGHYIRLLAICWIHGSIPSETEALVALLKPVNGEQMAVLSPVIKCFVADNGRLIHPRLEKERKKQNEFRKQKSEAGKTGAKTRWNKDLTNDGSAIVLPMAKNGSLSLFSSSTLSSKKDIKNTLSGKKKKPDPVDLENFYAIWSLYPEKIGRKEASRHFNATVKTEADLELIKTALQNYIAKVESDRDAGRDRPWQNGSTFFNNWRDWLDYKPPQAKPEKPDDGMSTCMSCEKRVPREQLDGYSICKTCYQEGL